MQGRRLGWLRSFGKTRKPRAHRGLSHLERLDPRLLLAADLVGHWRADDLNATVDDGGVVTSWKDSIGAIELQTTGQPKLEKFDLGGRSVVRFDTSDGNDAFRAPEQTNPLSGADNFSVALVFRTDATNLVGGQGVWYENTGLIDSNLLNLGKDWGLTINASGQLAAGMTGGIGTTAVNAYTAAGLNDGTEHLAVMTRSGGDLKIYVDGQLAASQSGADADTRSTSGLMIGALLTNRNYFNGDIAEVRLYSGTMDAGEVAALNSQMVAYYNNSAPQANPDTYNTTEDAIVFPVSVADGVLKNDVDPEGDPKTATLVQGPQHGTLQFKADGSFVYDSDPDFFGVDTFTYQVSDFQPGTIATVTINVQGVYDGPRTTADSYLLRPGQKVTISAAEGLLANDQNPDQLPLTVELVDNVGKGALTLRADGSFDYDPQGFAGRTSFSYRIDDTVKKSAPVTVNLAINTPPQAVNDTYSVNEDQTLVVFDPANGVAANDLDAEKDALTVTVVDTTTNGVLGVQSNGALSYVPNANFFGTDQFTYFVSDGFDQSGLATVTINVTSVNDLPTGAPEGYFVLPGNTLQVPVDRGLLVNDTDIDGPALTAVRGRAPANGDLQLNANGSFTYVPRAGFEGTDTFTYFADDSQARSAEVEVSIAVLSKPFVINELMASNTTTLETRVRSEPTARFTGLREAYDWIEIRNVTGQSLELSGFYLSDDADNPTKWQFPAGTVVDANGYLVVFASGLDISDPQLDEKGYRHTNFKISSAGENLLLSSPEGTVMDDYSPGYPVQTGNISYGIAPDGSRAYLLNPTPGLVNEGEARVGFVSGPKISGNHGFFTQAFEVTIENTDAEAVLRYTTDGSEPTESSQAYSGPITINRTTVLRARSFKANYLPSRVDTRTYIFLDDVLTQSADGRAPEGWPTRWGSNATDYGMDPEIVNSPIWGPQMHEALTQIPSMSIVTDLPNLFDSRNGIYAQPSRDGEAAERPASLELINPDGSQGFQTNIGLRIRGGFSRSTDNPKHAFRLFFDSIYGDGNLQFPLFGDEGAGDFAKVDLRTTQNYSWAFQGDSRNTFLRDVFSRDLQRLMGHESTRGEYYHLYINGMYFGLYQTDERPEANFGASYFGGDPDDYDVVHNDPRQNAATNGNTDAYRRLWERFMQPGGLSDANMEDYYRVQGMNPDGTRNPEYERMLDVDNVIDYMIITYYTSDADGPGSKFTRPGLNNYFAVYNRENPDGWKFFEHDSEHSLDTGNAAGANYNMVSPLVNNGRTFGQFNPHWMHEQLANSNSDYLVRFRDRVAELFQEGGLLDDENVQQMLRDRASEIDMAIIAESARWGDAKVARPFTKDTWERAVNTTLNWVTSRDRGAGRRSEVLKQLERERWWDFTVNAPTFGQNGGRVEAGFQLSVDRVGDGMVYVSTDGTDPRMSGGGINPNAIAVTPGQSVSILTGSNVIARTLNGQAWSTATEARFFVEPLADSTNFRVSEVHYNPSDPTEAEIAAGYDNNNDFEFIELVNISDRTIDLSSAKLRQISINDELQGVEFDFAKGAISKLAPGQSVLVVEDLGAFQARYGSNLPVAGQWVGRLSNGGETITVEGDNGSIHQFTFSDEWHPETDGDGKSLELVNPSAADLASWNNASSWRASQTVGGTPGSQGRLAGDSNNDGVFDSKDFIAVFLAGEYEDGIPQNSTFEEGDWNGDGDFDSADFVYVFLNGNYDQGQQAAASVFNQNTAARDSIFADYGRSLLIDDGSDESAEGLV